jgi:hypothetical protein
MKRFLRGLALAVLALGLAASAVGAPAHIALAGEPGELEVVRDPD